MFECPIPGLGAHGAPLRRRPRRAREGRRRQGDAPADPSGAESRWRPAGARVLLHPHQGRRSKRRETPRTAAKRTLTKSVDEAIKGCARNSVPDAVLLNAAVDAYARLGAVDDALP